MCVNLYESRTSQLSTFFSTQQRVFIHHEGREISAYAEIYLRIYSDKFSYIRK